MLQRLRGHGFTSVSRFFPYPIGITLTVAKRLGILNTMLID